MARKTYGKTSRSHNSPLTPKKDQIPPGATKRASDADLRPGEPPSTFDDRYAAGTPGGGTEFGGLAGSNFGDGRPEVPELNESMAGSAPEPEDVEPAEDDAYSGLRGGAVGGTPAGKRSSGGGKIHRGLRPGSSHRGDSTIGQDPDRPSD
jgi:hypothetical protein